MGTFSILFRVVLRSTPPIFSFVLIFSNLFPISTGLIAAVSCLSPRKFERGHSIDPYDQQQKCIKRIFWGLATVTLW